MNGQQLRAAREQRHWTQVKAAERLGVSQPYLALLETGKREFGPRLVRRLAKVLKLGPTVLPLREKMPGRVDPQSLAQQFASLGYPGFAYLRAARKRNPAEVLLTALAQDNLESRLTEGLPWLVLNYIDMDRAWLVNQAKLHDLTNRLGFVVTLAKGVAARVDGMSSTRYQALERLEEQLRASRLDKEDTLCQSSLSQHERAWLRETRPEEASYWHLLTDWRPEHLQYAR
jgi:transcriptional regulator with XRE-family HTH domain